MSQAELEPSPEAVTTELVEFAPAKINLTLRVLGRRPDGYHDLDSLVVFARVGDRLTLIPGHRLALHVRGPTARVSGPVEDNLVLKAARALATLVPGLRLGSFTLVKRLPVGAGLGGGSADAAAALRLLARVNGLARDDRRLLMVARATGADVPVCLDPRARVMRGIGDELSAPLVLPRLPALLVNPRIPIATKDVFAAWSASAGPSRSSPQADRSGAGDWIARAARGLARDELIADLARYGNDLEAPAIGLQPVVAQVLTALRATDGCRLARMSGSGATCFALYDTLRAAQAARRAISAAILAWWVRATTLGS